MAAGSRRTHRSRGTADGTWEQGRSAICQRRRLRNPASFSTSARIGIGERRPDPGVQIGVAHHIPFMPKRVSVGEDARPRWSAVGGADIALCQANTVAAIESMLGVRICGLPWHPNSPYPRSSATISTILRLRRAARNCQPAAREVARNARRERDTGLLRGRICRDLARINAEHSKRETLRPASTL
jgi:hypothetical protein